MEDFNEIFADFIEKEGFASIGDDMYKCREGETWHINAVYELFYEIMDKLRC